MKVLRINSKGAEVKKLQELLTLCGYGLFVDGSFGQITDEAVRAFQKDQHLVPDGIVGINTWAALEKVGKKSKDSAKKGLKKSRRRIDYIVVHCTATRENQDIGVEEVRKWHTAPKSKGGNGWSDIGYHYLIRLNGELEYGRDVDKVGAHAVGYNANSIGVVYVGGLSGLSGGNKDSRTPAQKDALIDLLERLRKFYPNAKIVGHCDLDKHGKTCPNFDAKREYANI